VSPFTWSRAPMQGGEERETLSQHACSHADSLMTYFKHWRSRMLCITKLREATQKEISINSKHFLSTYSSFPCQGMFNIYKFSLNQAQHGVCSVYLFFYNREKMVSLRFLFVPRRKISFVTRHINVKFFHYLK